MSIKHELVGSVHPIERIGPPVSVVSGVVSEKSSKRHIAQKHEDWEDPFEIWTQEPPQGNISDRSCKPKKADGVRYVDEGSNYERCDPIPCSAIPISSERETPEAD